MIVTESMSMCERGYGHESGTCTMKVRTEIHVVEMTSKYTVGINKMFPYHTMCVVVLTVVYSHHSTVVHCTKNLYCCYEA